MQAPVMKPVSIIQDKGNGFVLACCRTGSNIVRKGLNAKLTDGIAAMVAEAEALFPGREVITYLPPGVKP